MTHRPRVVIIGGGFAGYNAARVLNRKHRREIDVTLLNPTDFMLYQPLLPDVVAGIVHPRHVAVSLAAALPYTRLLPGSVTGLDADQREVRYVDSEGRSRQVGYDRLIVSVGAVNKVLPIEGSQTYSHGLKGLPEALYLRDHIIRQVELAAVAEDPEERRARLTFVVVGAGYTGTETAAVGQLFTRSLLRRYRSLAGVPVRWVVVQYDDRVLPELRLSLARTAERVLRKRGAELRLGTTVRKAAPDGVLLSDGEFVPARTIVWTTGVRPDPVIDAFGLPTVGGRIQTDEFMAVSGHPEIYAAGDAAAVPDLAGPGEITPMTGQHAERHGAAVARNVAASLGLGRGAKPYQHRLLGFLVDLGGWQAAADPLGVPLSGVIAKLVTRGYHLYVMPGNRIRVAADWVLDAVLPRQVVQLGLVRGDAVPLDSPDPELPQRVYPPRSPQGEHTEAVTPLSSAPETSMPITTDIQIHAVNVLVIGSGAAGLRAAIAAADAGCEVLVVGKRARTDAHTVLAAGGINAVLGTRDPQDSWQQHFADTYKEGYGLGDPAMIEILVREAPDAVRELADWGAPFSRLPDGRLDQRFFGAHTYRRTCFAGDWTGRAVLETLARKSEGIPMRERFYVTELLHADGECFGAFGFDLDTGARTAIYADAVVLAAGGHTRMWRRSSSRRDENTGDGMSLALRAGCRLADLELVQFHPSGMTHPEEIAGTLVTEAVRGEGGRLYNANGERFMAAYDPERLELSTRDRVALACYTEITEGRGGPHGGIFLDISHQDKALILERLPRMYRQFLDHQLLDISTTPMEVAPTAHYSMGGVVVDAETTATDLTGLYAAGEVTAGVHGANRLGGNSLAETVVFGRRAGQAAAAWARDRTTIRRPATVVAAANERLASLIKRGAEFARPLQRDLRDLMWERCGVVRDEDGLKQALLGIEALTERAQQVDVSLTAEGHEDLAHLFDLQASLLVAKATVLGAIARRETRGCHNRSDYPELDETLTKTLEVSMDERELLVGSRALLEPAPELARLAALTPDLDPTGRLTE